jgi:hypothetical protein
MQVRIPEHLSERQRRLFEQVKAASGRKKSDKP